MGGGLRNWLGSFVILAAAAMPARAAELCRYAGTTDYAGQAEVTTRVFEAGGTVTVDVTVNFTATELRFFHLRYMIEEISVWRGAVLQSVAVNNRSFAGTDIVRQQWDHFLRGPEGLQAHRVQAKTLEDFRLRHPGFVQHWDPETFGAPWLQDYQAAVPERRPDLDLPAAIHANALRTPFAMAFYWVRFLPPHGQDVTVFLPGFKADKVAELPISAVPSSDGLLWYAPLRYPAFSLRPVSSATALTTRDGHLRELAFDLHGARGSARGLIRAQGCQGTPVVPVDWQP